MRKKQVQKDQKGGLIMEEENLKLLCLEDNLYEYPEMNNKIYLHFKSIEKIDGLDNFINLRTLYLENNLIMRITGLDKLVNLQFLFLQNNLIKKISGLDFNTKLYSLNLSHNNIFQIQNIEQLQELNNLDLSQNYLKNLESIEKVQLNKKISTLELSHNQIEYDEKLLEVFKQMDSLKCLYLQENPCQREFKNYRKLLIGTIPNLTYLDNRNVIDYERKLSKAWVEGGDAAMHELRKQEEQKKQEQKKRDSEESLKEWRQKREQRIKQFEKNIKECLIAQKKYEIKLQESIGKNDELGIEYFDSLVKENIKNIGETEILLKDMRNLIKKQQMEEGADIDSIEYNQEDQPLVIFTQKDIETLIFGLVQKHQGSESQIYEDFAEYVQEIQQKLDKKISKIESSLLETIVKQEILKFQNIQSAQQEQDQQLDELD